MAPCQVGSICCKCEVFRPWACDGELLWYSLATQHCKWSALWVMTMATGGHSIHQFCPCAIVFHSHSSNYLEKLQFCRAVHGCSKLSDWYLRATLGIVVGWSEVVWHLCRTLATVFWITALRAHLFGCFLLLVGNISRNIKEIKLYFRFFNFSYGEFLSKW